MSNSYKFSLFGGGMSGSLIAAGLSYAIGNGFWYILGHFLLSWAYIGYWLVKYLPGILGGI